MRPRRSRIILVLTLVAVAALGLWVRRPVLDMMTLHSLQRIIVNGRTDGWAVMKTRSPLRTKSLAAMHQTGQWIGGKARWDDWHYRWVRFFTDGPIDSVCITGGSIDGNVSAVLARLPHLESLTLYAYSTLESGTPTTDADLIRLLQMVRAVPQVEVLQLAGDQITDELLATLHGHPRLRFLALGDHVTPKCIDTLRTMPALQEVLFATFSGSTPFSLEEQAAMKAALAPVRVEFK